MKRIDLLELLLWTVRRNERDTIHMYDSLSDLMMLGTGGSMLNFGYWDEKTDTPLEAQRNLCRIFGRMAGLAPNQTIVDVGSGFASPAALWSGEYSQPDITCVNINFEQLRRSKKSIPQDSTDRIKFVNSTARILPFRDDSVDRVLALESAQHFKPLEDFVSESYRILKKNGVLALAIPVVEMPTSFVKLGILSMTWSSEHYGVDYVESVLEKQGFDVTSMQKIGSSVYEPLADYYAKNRQSLKQKILEQYQSYVEKILYISMQKMKQVSEDKVIDYLLISCKK